MKIRLGYVAIALNLKKVTSSSTITYSRYSKFKTNEEKLSKLKEVTYSNLKSLEQILEYNIKEDIHFYRLTSNLIPLATHPEVMWNYGEYFKKDFEYIGNIIKRHNMRIDTHPDQFNVINSLKEKVIKDTIRNLEIQADWFDYLKYDKGKLVLHIGSGQGGKEESINRFINNLKLFPDRVVSKIILENDDKVFTAKDVLDLCNKANIPMVLDVHHHLCNNDGIELSKLIGRIFDTWSNENLPPKIHFSSPKEFELDRKHSDYIDINSFIDFVTMSKELCNKDYDVMIEAKQKDLALIKLVEDIKKHKPEWKFLDKTTIEI